MKATELRIGNLVQTDNSTNIVKDIRAVDIIILLDIESDSEFYHPIPLTEEWLLKFGFEKKSNNIQLSVSDFEFCLFNTEDYITIYHIDSERLISINECMYIHQLQNLFFALTCEELTI